MTLKEIQKGISGLSLGISLLIIVIILSMCFFIVDETELAVVSQFGRPVKTVTEAGIYFTLPEPIQVVRKFDNRLVVSESSLSEILTSDKKNLVVDYIVMWRINDPLLFMQSVFDEQGAKYRIGDIVYSELRSQLGLFELGEIINQKRGFIHSKVTENSQEKLSTYGIEVIDVRIRRLNFPDQNKAHVFERMRSERERMANKYRSEGEEEALKIRAEAEKNKVLILSDAQRNASILMGQADAEAARIYAKIYEIDTEFYQFVRTLQAYKQVIPSGGKTLILSSDSEMFKYLNSKE